MLYLWFLKKYFLASPLQAWVRGQGYGDSSLLEDFGRKNRAQLSDSLSNAQAIGLINLSVKDYIFSSQNVGVSDKSRYTWHNYEEFQISLLWISQFSQILQLKYH